MRRPAGLVVLMLAAAAGPLATPSAADAFRLGPLGAVLEIQYETLDTTIERDGAEIEAQKIDFVAPRVALRAGGYLIDPRILILDAGLGGRLESGAQERFGEKRGIKGEVVAYDVSLGILAQNRFSLTVQSARSEAAREYPYALPTEVESGSSRIELGFRRIALPGALTLSRSELRETTPGPFAAPRDHQETALEYRASHLGDRHRLDLHARRRELVDRTFSAGSNVTDSASARLRAWDLTETIRDWTSSLDYFGRRGAAAQSSASVSQEVRLEHTDSLRSDHIVALRRDDASPREDARSQLSSSWSSGLVYRFYQSLETRVRVGGNRASSPTGKQTSVRGEAQVDYRKRLGESGRLRAGWRSALEQRRFDGPAGELLVADERHVASFAEPFLLDAPNVVAASVVVASEGGSVIYREGLDWVASAIGNLTEVRILPGGAILDGQPLSVSYHVTRPGESTTGLRNSGWHAALDWGGLGLYLSESEASESASPVLPSPFLRDERQREYGVRWRRQAGGWSMSAEAVHVERETTAIALEEDRVVATVAGQLSRDMTLSFGVQQVDSEFLRPARRREIVGGNAALNWRPYAALMLGLRMDYRDLADSAGVGESYVAGLLTVQWSYGQLSVIASAGQYALERGDLSQRTFRSTVTVTRRL